LYKSDILTNDDDDDDYDDTFHDITMQSEDDNDFGVFKLIFSTLWFVKQHVV